MKITTNWLKDHLDTKLNENQIIEKLTDIGLEVENVEAQSSDLDNFLIVRQVFRHQFSQDFLLMQIILLMTDCCRPHVLLIQ